MKWLIISACLIFLDIVSGIMKALYEGEFSSRGLRLGGLRKLSELVAVVIGFGMETAQVYWGIHNPLPTCAMFSTYIILMELISIFENLGEISPGLRQLLSPILKNLKGGSENERD